MERATPFPWEHDGETVAFETPEQTRIEYRVAPLGSRFAAALIDQLVIAVVTVLLWLLVIAGLFALSGSGVPPATVLYAVALALVFRFLFSLFYFVRGEVRGEGQTWGKRLMKVRAILLTGQGITFGASLVRNLARVVDNIPLLWIVPTLTRGKRRFGDLLAGTIVIEAGRGAAEKPEIEWLAPSWAELTDRRFYFTGEQAEKLYPDDLNLLEHLEDRLRGLGSMRRRQQVLGEVARRYVERLDIRADEERVLEDPRRFLQELGLFLRDRFEGEAY
jgi:uncharacterized RDD family membrane protein YckC